MISAWNQQAAILPCCSYKLPVILDLQVKSLGRYYLIVMLIHQSLLLCFYLMFRANIRSVSIKMQGEKKDIF